MPATPIAPDFNEAFDIKSGLSPKLTLNLVLAVNGLSEAVDFLFSKVTHLGIRADIGLS